VEDFTYLPTKSPNSKLSRSFLVFFLFLFGITSPPILVANSQSQQIDFLQCICYFHYQSILAC